MLKAVLIKSPYRFKRFLKKLEEYNVEVTVLDFKKHDWVNFDYSDIDFLVHYPIFNYSSNHRQALQEVYDNLEFLNDTWPNLVMYPDPTILKYYNDKYRQYLFLCHHNLPIPETIPLFSEESVALADKKLGYPMVLKNRYGAGGGQVFQVHNKKELSNYFQLSQMNFFSIGALKYFYKSYISKRIFYYWLIKAKKCYFPFLSAPLIAQKFLKIDKDLKTVTGNKKVVEAHWRYQAHDDMWKMNIDDGGTGVWEYVPKEAIDLSVQLAKILNTRWLNIDFMQSNGKFLISEFSPVWHHYGYKESPDFVYKDDYNLETPLEISLDLERIIVESLIDAVK